MKEWADKAELLARLVQACKDVVETVPKQDVYNIEAGKFLAMVVVLNDWNTQTSDTVAEPQTEQEPEPEQPSRKGKRHKDEDDT